MKRNALLFLSTFVLGALLTLGLRAAMFEPHAGQPTAVAADTERASMVHNHTPTPAETPRAASAPAAKPDAHAHHGEPAEKSPAQPAKADGKPVNTVCAICGMDVDPKLPTAEYQGQTIGFGCRMCPPKFKADPDRYGPYYLKNQTIDN
jgi:YHS domain-containing protein